MGKPQNAMEIFALLDKSNCRKCGEKTCLAFAGAVFTGRKQISDCPQLTAEQVGQFSRGDPVESEVDREQDAYVNSLVERIKVLDFQETAVRIGGEVIRGVLTVNVMGKTFGIDRQGQFTTDLHVIPWIVVPVLEYMCDGRGLVPGGDWLSFREIPGGREKYGLFQKRGEAVLQGLADKYPDFMDDIVHMFDGKSVSEQFQSDISVVLHPLPLVPMMLCYWKPEEGMSSSINIFFDKTVHENLGVESAFFLGTGFSHMINQLALQHAF